MHRLEEMPRLEKVRNAVERLVVDQDGAKQCLLQLDIVRGRTKGRGRSRIPFSCGQFQCHRVSPFGCMPSKQIAINGATFGGLPLSRITIRMSLISRN